MVTKIISKVASMFGYSIVSTNGNNNLPPDFEDTHKRIIRSVQNYTMTSHERLYGLIEAVNYISKHNIEGDIVECGVWRGGSMMAVALALLAANDISRDLYLFDTYEGMSEPDSKDIDVNGLEANAYLEKNKKTEEDIVWAYAPIELVTQNLLSTHYPIERLKFVKGKVENTLPHDKIGNIALLRLDTDWYASTKHEMEVLFPKLQKGGVLIIDDYGHWKGSKEAVDEYFAKHNIVILLNRLDYTGRIGIKY